MKSTHHVRSITMRSVRTHGSGRPLSGAVRCGAGGGRHHALTGQCSGSAIGDRCLAHVRSDIQHTRRRGGVRNAHVGDEGQHNRTYVCLEELVQIPDSSAKPRITTCCQNKTVIRGENKAAIVAELHKAFQVQ